MSAILDVAVEFTVATTRWSGRPENLYTSGTLWYGMMCRSFLLLEKLLRLCVVELFKAVPDAMRDAAERRAGAKPPEVMTMGQCLGVVEAAVPSLDTTLKNRYPQLSVPSDVLPKLDRLAWNRLVSLRTLDTQWPRLPRLDGYVLR
jgi:hypothetical protein